MAEIFEEGLTPVDVEEELAWSWIPLATSLVVALGGIAGGWWLYGRKPLEEGEPDPLIRPLGPLYSFLNQKWKWDELYHVVFYKPTFWFSETFVNEWVDQGIIDGTLHIIARAFFAFGRYCKRFEEIVISGGVDKLKDGRLNGIQNHVDVLESNLNQITSSFSSRVTSKHLNLSHQELQVSNYIIHGKTTKEIAELMGLSSKTIDFHRAKIRKKAGISNRKKNLRTFLLSLQ